MMSLCYVLELQDLLEDFGFLPTRDDLLVICENNLEAVAKPDHNLLDVPKPNDAGTIDPEKHICW